MALQIVSSFVAGDSIDILAELLNVRTGLPASSTTVTVAVNLWDSNQIQRIFLAPMAPASFTPPGFWLYTFQSQPTSTLGTWVVQFQATDTSGGTFLSNGAPVFTLITATI